jgi:hypothetical protein
MRMFIDKYNTPFNKNFIFSVFLLAYIIFIIYLCINLNVWIDEIYTLNTTSYSVSGVIKQSYYFEGQPPLYFLLLSFWRTINSSIFFARLFSLISVGAAAFIFYKLANLICQKKCSRWVIVLFLLNPFTVWASSEIRLYAFVLMLSLLSLYYFFLFYVSGKSKFLIIFVFISIAGIYTQYLFVFLLASLAIATLIFKGWKIFFKFSLYLLPVAILFLLNMLFTPNPAKLTHFVPFDISFVERLVRIFHAPQDLVLAAHLMPFSRAIRWGIFFATVFFAALAYKKWYLKGQNKLQVERINFILLSGMFLMLFIAVFFVFTGIEYSVRYMTIGFPFLFTFFLLFDVFTLLKKAFIFLTISIVYILALLVKYEYPVKDFDVKSLVNYLGKSAKKGEPILFYQKLIILPVQYYYKGNNPIIPLLGNVKFDSTYLTKIKDTCELRAVIENINTQSQSYLLVTNRIEAYFKDQDDIKLLNSYLPYRYNITLDTLVYGHNISNPLRIRRLEKKLFLNKY